METKDWKWFRVDNLFDVVLTKGDIKADRIDNGDIPLVSSGESNNGIVKYIDKDGDGKAELFSSNTITLDMFCHTYYQPCLYYAVGHGRVNILKPKFTLNKYIGMFICSLIDREIYRFSYGRAVYSSVAKEINLKLPAILNAQGEYEPDWQWIENYVKETLIPKLSKKSRQVWQKQFDNKPLSHKKLELNTKEWQWFRVGKIFKLEKCKCSNATELLENGDEIAYIGAKKNDNGIMNYVKKDDELISKGHCIVFIGDGQGSVGYCTYQPKDFIGSTTLIAGYNNNLNDYNAIFLVGVLDQERYRYSFGRKYKKKVIDNSRIKLPAILNAQGEYEPDWQFMEDYIKSLPYSACL